MTAGHTSPQYFDPGHGPRRPLAVELARIAMLVCLFFAVTATQTKGPVERYDAFMAKADGLTLEYTVSEPTMPGDGTCKLELRRPNMQKYSVKLLGESLLYVHSMLGGISIRDDLKEYFESEPLSVNFPPPLELVGNTSVCYPMIVLAKSLKEFDDKAKFEVRGKGTVRGKECDIVFFEGTNLDSLGSNTLWIDSQGRLLRLNQKRVIQDKRVDLTYEFTRFEATSPTDPKHYANTLPVGYMPYAIPATRTRTLMVAERAVFGTWIDARTDAKVDVKAMAAGSPVLTVFTDPDCAVCAKMEPFLVAARTKFKAKGCALIEVSLGTKKPDTIKKDKDRRVYWDKDGAIERAYGIPGTPYFLLSDSSGRLVRGWQGYTKEQEPLILKELLSAFDKT